MSETESRASRDALKLVGYLGALACAMYGLVLVIWSEDNDFTEVFEKFEIDGLRSSQSLFAIGLLAIATAGGAVFSALYLYLHRSTSGPSKHASRRLSLLAWKTVEVPFMGRLAAVELTLLLLWVALQCMTMYHFYQNWVARYANSSRRQWSKSAQLMGICRMFGIGLAVNLAVFMVPVSKHSFWLELVDVGFERAVRVHRWLGVLIIVFTLAHFAMGVATYAYSQSLAYCMGWTKVEPEDSYCREKLVTINIYGEVALAGGILLGATSFPVVRRFSYQLFYYSHLIGAFLFFVFGIVHDGHTFYYLFPGVVTYAVDKVISVWRRARSCSVVHFSVNDDTACTKLELAVSRGSALPRQGHWYHLNIKEASALEWHPMSVAETNEEAHTITFYIRHTGNWSTRVGKVASSLESAPTVRLDGPFGGTHTEKSGYMANDATAFISGGIGITAHLLGAKAAIESGAFRHVALRWFVTSRAFVDQHAHSLLHLAERGVDVHVYITRDAVANEAASVQPSRVWSIGAKAGPLRRYSTVFSSPLAKCLMSAVAAATFIWGMWMAKKWSADREDLTLGAERGGNLAIAILACVAGALFVAVVATAFDLISSVRGSASTFQMPQKGAGVPAPGPEALCESDATVGCISLGGAESEVKSPLDLMVSQGRPQLETVMSELAHSIASKDAHAPLLTAGVSVCGPCALVDGVVFAAQFLAAGTRTRFIIDEEEYAF